MNAQDVNMYLTKIGTERVGKRYVGTRHRREGEVGGAEWCCLKSDSPKSESRHGFESFGYRSGSFFFQVHASPGVDVRIEEKVWTVVDERMRHSVAICQWV